MSTLRLGEIAEHLDMSESNASAVMRALGIDRDAADLAACRVAYIRDLREKAAGRGGDDQYNLTQQRARQASVDANLKELQYWREVGELVAVKDLEQQLSAWAVGARAEIENCVARIVAGIESQHGIDIDSAVVDSALGAALDALAAYPTSPADDALPLAGAAEEAEEIADD